MRQLLTTSILAISLALGAATAQAAAEAATTATGATGESRTVAGYQVAGKGDACIPVRNIDGWSAVDREHVILEGPGKTRHLARYSGTCFNDPKFELRLGVQSRNLQLCGGAGDYLLIGGERCMVLDMWELPAEAKRTAVTP